MKELKYYQREEKEMKAITDKIKKRYGTLILKSTSDNVNVKGNDSFSKQSTTVYGNGVDENEADQVFEKIESDELGLDKLSQDEIKELKQLRNTLIDLCNNIQEIIMSHNLIVDDSHKKELRDFIDDTLLWVHIHEKPTKVEFKSKIDEINDACNKIKLEYDKSNKELFDYNSISKDIHSNRDELEQLCLTIKSSIECNAFSLKDKQIDILNKCVDDNLLWILQKDIDTHNNLNKETNKILQPSDPILSKEVLQEHIDEYIKRINEINELCNNLYKSMVGVNLNTSTNILGATIQPLIENEPTESIIIITDEYTNSGSSIDELIKNRENNKKIEYNSA